MMVPPPAAPRLLKPTTPLIVACGLLASAVCTLVQQLLHGSTSITGMLFLTGTVVGITMLVAHLVLRSAPVGSPMFGRSVLGGVVGGAAAGALGFLAISITEHISEGRSSPDAGMMLVIGAIAGAFCGLFIGFAIFPLLNYTRALEGRRAADAFDSGLFVAACVVGVSGFVNGTLAALSAKANAFEAIGLLGLSGLGFVIVGLRDMRRRRFLLSIFGGEAKDWSIVLPEEGAPALDAWVDVKQPAAALAFTPTTGDGPFRANQSAIRVHAIDATGEAALKQIGRRAKTALAGVLLTAVSIPLIAFGFFRANAHTWMGPRAEPWRIPDLSEPKMSQPVRLAMGDGATCAHLEDATIKCWGNNGGTVAGRSWTAAHGAEAHLTLGRVRLIAPGRGMACAVHAAGDHRALCWGANYSGQLGDGTRNERKEPVVVGPPNVVALAHGEGFTIALTEEGHVWRWGTDLLDSSDLRTEATKPALVEGLADIRAIGAGNDYACALDRSGKVFCFGASRYGELAVVTQDRLKPTLIGGLPDKVERLVVGPKSTWVRAANDKRWWGWGERNPWGPDTPRSTGASTDPVVVAAIPGTDDFEDVHLGWNHACGRRANGSVACWGDNDGGHLGSGTLSTLADESTQRSEVRLPGPVLELVGSQQGTCARLATGVWCWGWP